MLTASYEKTFEWNGQKIELTLLKAPVDKGIVGIMRSELFEHDVGIVEDATPAEERDYSLACLKRAEEVHAVVFMLPEQVAGLRRGEALAESILLHEVGHYICGKLKIDDIDQRKRIARVEAGTVEPKELEADAVAARFLGSDRVVSAFEEMKRQIIAEYSGPEYDQAEVAIVLKEIDSRISAVK